MKKKLSLLLVFLMCFALAVPAHAYDTGKVGTSTTISTGGGFSAMIDTSGSLWTWGDNRDGTLGNGGTGNDTYTYFGENIRQTVPMKIMDDVVSVSCGSICVAAIKTDGSLWMWGSNSRGQLGNGSTENAITPIKILDGVVAVSCGQAFTAAIKNDGSLWMWGNNESYQLGNDSTENALTPIKIMDGVVAVSCGWLHTAAIKADGSLWMWGSNAVGELGNGGAGNKTDGNPLDPYYVQSVPIKIMDDVVSVSCGYRYTAVIKNDGSLWMWGNNSKGQLGNSRVGNDLSDLEKYDEVSQNTPVKIMDGVVAVSCGGGDSTAAIKTDGSLWMWGENQYGQLGFSGGNAADSYGRPYQTVPVKVMDGAAAVSCGHGHTATIKTDGSLWMWGYNLQGQLGNGGAGNAVNHLEHTIQTDPIKILDQVAVPAASTQTSAFSDVPANAYYADAVAWAVEKGVTTGTGDGTTFSPDQTCTKAQIITFLWRAAGSPEPKGLSHFSDAKSDAYYAKATAWAAENGMTSGDTFAPDAPCTREMAVEFMWKNAGSPSAAQANFTDVSSGAVNWAVEKGVTTGTGDGSTFSPDQICTRGQIVTFLYRLMG